MRPEPRKLLSAFRRYAGKLATLRNEIRRERFLMSLPEEIRRDIGYPPAFDPARRR